MAELDNKYIPMQGDVTYTIDIRPKKVDPTGRIRSAEEIKKGTKEFVHTVYIDTVGNVYIIPSKFEDGEWVDAYTPRDIIQAAMGDEEAKKVLDDARAQIKQQFGKDLMSDGFMQRLYDQEKDAILDSVNRRRLEDGEEPIDMKMPKSPKTANNFTRAELNTVLATAQPIQSNGQVPPEG